MNAETRKGGKRGIGSDADRQATRKNLNAETQKGGKHGIGSDADRQATRKNLNAETRRGGKRGIGSDTDHQDCYSTGGTGVALGLVRKVLQLDAETRRGGKRGIAVTLIVKIVAARAVQASCLAWCEKFCPAGQIHG